MNKLRKLIALLLTLSICLTLMPVVFADSEAPGEVAAETPAEGVTGSEEDPPAETAPPTPEEGETGSDFGNQPEINLPLDTEEPAGDDTAAETDISEDGANADAEEEEDSEGKTARPWVEPGNSDAEILGGGRFLASGDRFYYSEGGIWLSVNGGEGTLLTWDNGTSLNLSGGYLYYISSNGDVRRLPAGGGDYEKVYAFETAIDQLYVMGDELRFVSAGGAYSYDMATGELEALTGPDNIKGLVPTPYGNLYLTGEVRKYTVWAETERLFDTVNQCYTDGDWLVVVKNGETLQASLSGLFEGNATLQDYSLHRDMLVSNGLSEEEQLANEAAFLESERYLDFMESIESESDDGEIGIAASYASSSVARTAASEATGNTLNIVKRARQMAELCWTPLKDRYAWGGSSSSYKITSVGGKTTTGYFAAGETYQGIPYSQAVLDGAGYVGWNLQIYDFMAAVNNSTSVFYSKYSTYNKIAPYYGSDCSGFVSWAWDLPGRCTCTTLLKYSESIGKSVSKLQLGDCLNDPNSHVVLITDIGYDDSGSIISIEVTEQTPAKMKVTCYGTPIPGKTYKNTGTIAGFQSYYLDRNYSIYRRSCSSRPNIGFDPSSYVPLGETGFAAAPKISVSVNAEGNAKVVTLSHSVSGAKIYYTTDGSTPTTASTLYTGPFSLTASATVRAIAECGGNYVKSGELNYAVTVTRAQAPFVVLVEGDMSEESEYVSSGSKITAMNEAGDKVYYTTDGSTPTRHSTPAPQGGITITSDMTFRAVAVSGENLNSEVVTLSVKVGNFHKITATVSGTGGYIQPGGDVGILHGENATFTIVPLENYKITGVKVDGKSVGAVSSYTFENITADHTITATFAVDLPFTDVPNNWAAPYISFAYSRNLFAGTTSTTFSPSNNMTRGMFISVLGRFAGNGQWTDLNSWSGKLGFTNGSAINIRTRTTTADAASVIIAKTGATGTRLHITKIESKGIDGAMWYQIPYTWTDPETGKKYDSAYIRAVDTDNTKTLVFAYTGLFSDLPDGQYYTGYAQWANIYGIMNGTTSTTFSPNSYIKREDICVLLYNYITKYLGKSISTTAGSPFTDDAKISTYAKNAVYAMKNIGVVNGYTSGSFRPQGYATRAEVATMFKLLYDWKLSQGL